MVKRTKKAERKERKRAGSSKRDKVLTSGGKNTIRIPDGVTLFRPVDKSYRLDFLLYEVGKGNKCADPGEWYYERTFYTHRIGVDNRYVVCPSHTFGKPCPVCEELARTKKDPDATEEEEKSLRVSQRQLFLVRDRDEPEKGVQIFEHSYFQFGRTLDECRNDSDEDQDYISNFDDPEGGACLRIKFRKNAPYGVEVSNIEFRPRPNGIDDELLDHGICLDDILVETSYKEIENILYQTVEGDDDDEDEKEDEPEEKVEKKPTRGRSRPKGSTKKPAAAKAKPKKKVVEEEPEDDDEDEGVSPAEDAGLNVGMAVEYEGMEMEIVKISGDGTSLTLEDEDGDKYRGVAVDEVKVIRNNDEAEEDEIPFDDDEEEEAPKKKRGRPKGSTKKKKVEEEPEEEEDDEEEDDEEEDDDDEDWDKDLDD